jgi:hypothetical protein
VGQGRVELHSVSTVFCSKLMLPVEDIVTTVSRVLNHICCRIVRGPGGEHIMVVPGGTELEPEDKTGSWAGRTHSQ